MNEQTAKPWYREPWLWLVLFPVILTLTVCVAMGTIAVLYADDTVSDTYYKDSRLYHFTDDQDERAAALGLAAAVQFRHPGSDPAQGKSTVTLDLSALDEAGEWHYPERLLLTMSHPVEADLDRHILLERIAAQRYSGSVPGDLRHRWYLRLMPELNPQQHAKAEWRLKGEVNFDLGDAVSLQPPK